MRIKFYLLTFIIFSIKESAFSQQRYAISQYTSENGLPQNSIKDIAADSDGFIWLATEDGLVRFDGRRFKVFKSPYLKAGDNRMSALRHGLRGVSGDGRNKQLYAFFYTGGILKIEKGTVYDGAAYARDKRAKWRSLGEEDHEVLESAGSPNDVMPPIPPFRYRIFVGNSEDDFYICEYDRVTYYENWKRKYQVPIFIGENDPHNYFSIGRQLYFFRRNRSIATIQNKQIVEMPLSGEILRDPAYKTRDKPIRLFWDDDSYHAFLYLDKNLYVLVQERDGSVRTKLLIEDFDFDSRGIKQVHFDNITGKVYLGSVTRGLFVLSKQPFQSLTRHGGDLENVFYAQTPFSSHAVLTPTGVVIGKNNQTGQVINNHIPAIKNGVSTDQRSIIRDNYGKIWTQRLHTLFQLDETGQNILKQWVLDGEVRAIYPGTKHIWLGLMGKGLFQLDQQYPGSQPKQVIADPLKEITCLESKSSSTLMVGTRQGLFTVDTDSEKVQLVKGTEGLFIKSIYANNPGQVWITALEKELMLWSGKGKPVTFPLDKDRYLANAHCIINDGRGYLWIPTNRGLFQMALADLLQYAALKKTRRSQVSRAFGKSFSAELFYNYHTMEEGFNTNEFNGNCQPCAVKLANGYISLPSLNGLVWFRPDQINHTMPAGEIVLDKAEVNLKSMAFSGDTLHFPANPENIRLDFSTPYFGNEYNLNLSYALKNQNSSKEPSLWIPIDSKDLVIRYSSLKSGKYILMIRKLDGFGLGNYSLKKIYLDIPPLWYETPWAKLFFLALILILLLVGVYYYVAYRLWKVNIQNEQLEKVIFLRTQALEKTATELEISKNQMSKQVHIMSRLLASISHDVQSPLHFIAYTSGDISDLVKEGHFEDVSRVGTMISDMSKRTSRLLKDLLDYVKVQVYGNRVYFEDINLRNLIDAKLELFQNIMHRNGNYYVNEVPDDIIVLSDLQLLSIVVHNLIDNAMKYTHNGEIRICAKNGSDGLTELVITNMGRGIPGKVVDIINSIGNEMALDYSTADRAASGLGLLIVKEIVSLIGVRISVSQTDITRFCLTWNDNKE